MFTSFHPLVLHIVQRRYNSRKGDKPTDYRNFTYKAKDGKEISATKWFAEGSSHPRAIVQIVHGMSEHRGRYTHFARYLVNAGFVVYAEDHRGHGETAGSLNTVGFFEEKDGWDLVIDDIHRLSDIARTDHPGLPLFLFGHSMGSILARDYISSYGGELAGAILSGANGNPGPMLSVAIWLAKRQIAAKGARAQSFQLDNLTFGSYNRAFKPASTKFDWLSRDEREVGDYIADPACGGVCTAGFFYDLFKGTQKIFRKETIHNVPKNLPLYFMSGTKDPVGKFGRGVRKSAGSYRRAGIADVTVKLYPDARHEMLHESNKVEVYDDIVAWLGNHMQST